MCEGTGQLIGWRPDAKRAECHVCGQIVPVASDHKRTWLKKHEATSEKGARR